MTYTSYDHRLCIPRDYTKKEKAKAKDNEYMNYVLVVVFIIVLVMYVLSR